MSFGEAIKTCFKKYVDFSGRARRSEFWFWMLFTAIIGTAVGFLERSDHHFLSSIVPLAFFLPNLAVSVRRMHDIGRSGWYVLISLIPIVGVILFIVQCCRDSVPGANKYGENPKGQGVPVYAANPYAVPVEPDYSAEAQEAVFTDVKEEEPINSSTATTTGFCPYCDTPITIGQKFCTGCGHSLDV